MRLLRKSSTMGNKTAYNLIKKHGSIEAVLPRLKTVTDDYETKYKQARHLFTMYRDTLDMQQLTIHHSSRKFEELFEYLTKTRSMSELRVQNGIKDPARI